MSMTFIITCLCDRATVMVISFLFNVRSMVQPATGSMIIKCLFNYKEKCPKNILHFACIFPQLFSIQLLKSDKEKTGLYSGELFTGFQPAFLLVYCAPFLQALSGGMGRFFRTSAGRQLGTVHRQSQQLVGRAHPSSAQ